jgi:hypothetical protein
MAFVNEIQLDKVMNFGREVLWGFETFAGWTQFID